MLSISSKGSISATIPRVEYGFLGIPDVVGSERRNISLRIFDTSRSILKTVNDLWEKKYHFVASMIFLFSVVIPVVKGGLLTFIFFSKNKKLRNRIFEIIKLIAKWSMCDVFIVAILLAYLGTGASSTHNYSSITAMGYSIPVNVFVGMHASLQIGFWCFLTYCLLSLIALQLYEDF